jgi:hypothetical protein
LSLKQQSQPTATTAVRTTDAARAAEDDKDAERAAE